jgi:hypothetical protein
MIVLVIVPNGGAIIPYRLVSVPRLTVRQRGRALKHRPAR